MTSLRGDVHLVTGYPRCGTTVAVRVLDACGIPAVTISQSSQTRDGYQHQPGDYWEPPSGWFLSPANVRQTGGRCGKFLAPGVSRLVTVPGVTFRVLFMVRDRREVMRSHHRAFGAVSRYSAAQATAIIENLRGRPDVADVAVVNHRNLLTDPVGTVTSLRDRGWDVDPTRAGDVIDLEWWRNREES